MAALPAHLRPARTETDENRELRDLLRNDWPEPPRQSAYENPGSHRQRLLSERHAPAERKGPPRDDGDD